MFSDAVTWPAAFVAGLLSFFSPCILPLIPAYFTFITGFSLDELTGASARVRTRVIISTLAFISGFSIVFIALGASASAAGALIASHSRAIRIIGGALIVVFGAHLTGWIRIPFLDVEKRAHLHQKPLHAFGTVLVGMAFGAGWSPCIGPLLGSILVLAGNRDTIGEGMGLLAVYSAGLAIPFMTVSVFIHLLLMFLNRAKNVLQYVNKVAGGLLILIGIALMAGRLG
uniref:Cytochrome c biogenesis protein CcdA n=1 Tax=Desulfatirhabdium butyrativorans TaxID=340467 RepID=A0A7C4RUM2_9BACT